MFPLQPFGLRSGRGFACARSASKRRWSAASTVLLFALALPGNAQTAPDFSLEWRWSDFTGASRPGGLVHRMAEDGSNVWVLTDQRLVWFDGFEWRSPNLGTASVPTDMHALPGTPVALSVDGRLFLGDTLGFHETVLPELGPDPHVVDLAWADSTRLILLVQTGASDAARSALMLWQSGIVTPLPHPGAPDEFERLFATNGGGAFLGRGQELFRFRPPGGWVEFLSDPETASVGAISANPSGQGLLQSLGRSRSIVTWDEDGEPTVDPVEGQNLVLFTAITPDGVKLAIHDTGHLRIGDENGWTDARLDASRSQGVYHAFAQQNGEVWIASLQGLHLLRTTEQRWSRIRRPFPSQRNRINAVLYQEGSEALWLGTGDGLLRHIRGVTREFFELGGTPLIGVTSVAEDSAGGVWFSSGGAFEGAYRIAPDESWIRVGPDQGVGYVHRVAVDASGNVLFMNLRGGDGPGVYQRDSTGAVTRLRDPAGVLDGSAFAFAQSADGTRWFGTRRGLAREQGGVWTSWFREDIGARREIRDLAVDPAGVVWVSPGTDMRAILSRFDIERGVLVPEESDDGLSTRAVWSINFDEDGGLWLGTATGLSYRNEGSWSRFDGRMGLEATGVWPVVVREASVFVGTSNGLMVLQRAEAQDPAPRVRVRGTLAENGVIEWAWSVFGYRGKPNASEIEIRNRVDGGEWTSWRKGREVRYAGLGPGIHTMEVQAKGLFGQLSEPVSAEIRVPLPVFLRPMVAIPGVLLSMSLLLLGLQARERRVQRDEAIRSSEGRLRALLDHAPEAILIYHGDSNRIVDVNGQASRLLEMAPSELTSRSPMSLCPAVQPTGMRSSEGLAQLLARTLTHGEMTDVEWTFQDGEGTAIPTQLRITRLPEPESHLLRLSLVDLTDRKASEAARRELEVQLVQAQKLEAVGQLTGGIAHDFNNLLTVIRGNLEFLKSENGSAKSRRFADQAIRAAERGSELVRRLLAFSMRQTLAPKRVVLSEALEDLFPLIRRSQGESVEVKLRVAPDVGSVMVDRAQLDSAVMNLCLNSRDAMTHGGSLSITADQVDVDETMAELAEVDPGSYVRLTVADTGFGMSPELLDRVFEPFFTTKEVGKGSGLGLSMVYGFARQSGGFSRVTSEVGRGTQVHLYFPTLLDDAEVEPDPVEANGSGPVGETASRRILVVEDDPALRTLLEGLLKHLGHRVAAASSAQEAEILVSRGYLPEVLLSDVILPGPRNGFDLATDLRARIPDLGVGFISGYDRGSLPQTLDPKTPFLAKPFDQHELAALVEEALATPRTNGN